MQSCVIDRKVRVWQLILLLICSVGVGAHAVTQSPQQVYRAYFSNHALPLSQPEHLAPLYRAIGERRFVLLGESTHGTHEYYRWRAKISRHLITNKGFDFVAVEGDWQAIYRINDYVKLRTPDDLDARTLMRNELTRWPQWMWANEEFAEFVEWLRSHNAELPEQRRVGIFGLDMQDPEDSMSQVLEWFRQNDPEHYPQVAEGYQRILAFPENFNGYAQHLMRGGNRMDGEMAFPVSRLRAHLDNEKLSATTAKTVWATKQNALLVQRVEERFHGAIRQGPHSWNARARFMHETFERLASRHGDNSRGIAWAHNTHVGDAAATDMRNRGEVNIGQLARASAGEEQVFILGFGSHQGTVIAGSSWGGDRELMTMIPAHPQSYEGILHSSDVKQGLWIFDDKSRRGNLITPLHQRAVGVIYRPPHEAYVPTILTLRYDGFIYFDQTRALTPLHDDP
jgi:erythromycin esterase